jgi:hypothetical protein
MSNNAPRCFGGGAIGGPNVDIPTDLARYKRDANDRIGCNRLWCPRCESWVRHIDHFKLSGWMSSADIAELYAAPAPERTRFVSAFEPFRVYFCACKAHSYGGYDDVDLTDFGWICRGHPVTL